MSVVGGPFFIFLLKRVIKHMEIKNVEFFLWQSLRFLNDISFKFTKKA